MDKRIKTFIAVAILIVLYWGGNILNQRAIAYNQNLNQLQYIQQLENKNKELEGKIQELGKQLNILKEEQSKLEVR